LTNTTGISHLKAPYSFIHLSLKTNNFINWQRH